jgi:hypothetical protein
MFSLVGTPLDDTVYISTAARLYSFDSFSCLLPLTPPGGCPVSSYVGLSYYDGILYAASRDQLWAHPADPEHPTCGMPVLTASPGALTAVSVTPAGLFFSAGGAIYVAPLPQRYGAQVTPRALLQDTTPASNFTGVRTGLALWGGGGSTSGSAALLYAAQGTLNGQAFRGVLAADSVSGAALGSDSAFFRYSTNSTQNSFYWSAQHLAVAGNSTLAWSELRASPSVSTDPSYAVQRTRLSAPPLARGSVTVASSYLGPASSSQPASLAGDVRGMGVLWAGSGTTAVAMPAFPGQQRGEVYRVDLQAAVTGLAFALGDATCGYPFEYAALNQPSSCSPRTRVAPSTFCSVLPPAVQRAVAQAVTEWWLPLVVVLAVLLLLGLGLWRWCVRRRRVSYAAMGRGGQEVGSGVLVVAEVAAAEEGGEQGAELGEQQAAAKQLPADPNHLVSVTIPAVSAKKRKD